MNMSSGNEVMQGEEPFYRVRKATMERDLGTLFENLAAAGYFAGYESLERFEDKVWGADALTRRSAPSHNERIFLAEIIARLLDASRDGLITIVKEDYHIDSAYRDAYYHYYAAQHFDVGRFSVRLTFFDLSLDYESWYGCETGALKDYFMGSCVINPLSTGSIGRTFIDPQFLIDEDIAVRLSKFDVNVYGKNFTVEAFPYRKQDVETTRCAEVTLLNLANYYSNEFCDYASFEGSDIHNFEKRFLHERTTPSRGMTYFDISRVLSDMGFSPRLYNVGSLFSGICSKANRETRLKRVVHYYIESGIPVAVNPSPESKFKDGHSLICIGRADGSPSREAWDAAWDLRLCLEVVVEGNDGEEKGERYRKTSFACSVVNSADLCDTYVVVDDNQMPYAVRPFEHLSCYPEMLNENIVAPLHRRMVLDAIDAHEKIMALLSDPRHGVLHWAEEYLEEQSRDASVNVVMRLFLASSKAFKRFRVATLSDKTLSDKSRKMIYAETPLPQFVWVCELYIQEDYLEEKGAFAEIVLDATSAASDSYTKNIILNNYPDRIALRGPDSFGDELQFYSEELKTRSLIEPYSKNLKRVKSRTCEASDAKPNEGGGR